ncbi:MAG: non-canonical purine NTP pyrophosphatase [Phycisphaeraceae bacterium]|nr:non-canonical purine NTP pyrophosphatase [Phycisphaerales bacterium]MCB9861024.1 non-canonical purine NTP pyrophosphatase [Phycisphaeraceae bacterium]
MDFDTIVLATANPHKVDELRAIFAQIGIDVVSLAECSTPDSGWIEPDETGTTFLENATIKALSYADQTGMVCLADDSGIEIDALGGKPGVISSHYCTDGRDEGMSRNERDAKNNERVLRELDGIAFEQRSTRFVCVMVLAQPNGNILATSGGTFEGRIGFPENDTDTPSHIVPRGGNGFGYDPLFLVAPDYAHTGAELSPTEKNMRSHRAHAAHEMAIKFKSLMF